MAKTIFKLRVLGSGLKPVRDEDFNVTQHPDGARSFRLMEAIADALCNPTVEEISITHRREA